MKQCNHCGISKTFSKFGVDRQQKDNLNPTCKECKRGYDKIASDRRTGTDYMKAARLFHRYKISIEIYNKIFLYQNGRCAICNRHQSVFKRKLAVDHHHNAGFVRGLLCAGCNANVGKIECGTWRNTDHPLYEDLLGYIAAEGSGWDE